MNGKVHAFIGAGSLACFCLAYPKGFDLFGVHVIPQIGMATATVGSLLPDIDLQRSSMGQKHKVASSIVSKSGGGHRGITHTLLFCASLVLSLYCIAEYYASYEMAFRALFALVMGFTIKAVLDVISKHTKRIPWFIPLGAAIIILLLTLFWSNTGKMLSMIFSSMFGVGFGYIMHIWADLFNGKGVPLLWPISQDKISIMDLPSEGAVPWIFAVLNILVELMFIYGGELWPIIMRWITQLIS